MRLYVKSRIVQLFLLVFLLQFLVVISPLSPQTSLASPAVYLDEIWGDDPGNFNNDDIANAYYLGATSIKNNGSTPLNVSSWSPDYYNFSVVPGFYFSVFLKKLF